MVDILHHVVQDCRARGGGAADTRCRANAHGAASLMAARNRSFFWFLLRSQLHTPAEDQSLISQQSIVYELPHPKYQIPNMVQISLIGSD
jgi:hypothetical protein